MANHQAQRHGFSNINTSITASHQNKSKFDFRNRKQRYIRKDRIKLNNEPHFIVCVVFVLCFVCFFFFCVLPLSDIIYIRLFTNTDIKQKNFPYWI
jgi:hypothetical protein